MDLKGIAGMDSQIRKLEQQLSGLYRRRASLLEAELGRYRSRIEAFGAETGRDAEVARAGRTAPAKPKGKRARKQARTAKPVREPAGAGKVEARQTGGKKRTRTPSADVEKRILKALDEAGLFGLSQAEISKKSGLGYQTVLRKLKDLPLVTKKGSGRDGRFYLKAQ